jgi:acetyltransferase-like isoleucine patch superfamily enzyme
MKKIIKKLLKSLILIILRPSLMELYKKIFNTFTTIYIVSRLNVAGRNPYIMYPIYTNGLNNISIGDNFQTFARLRIEAIEKYFDDVYKPKIIIGNNVSINFDCHIGCTNYIKIGDNVLIASKVFITDHSHGNITKEELAIPPVKRKVVSKGPVIIGNNVWIGEGVAIMPNVKIGENSIIGANSVVTKDIPKNSVVAGNPAKIIKRLKNEL